MKSHITEVKLTTALNSVPGARSDEAVHLRNLLFEEPDEHPGPLRARVADCSLFTLVRLGHGERVAGSHLHKPHRPEGPRFVGLSQL